jgi:hypothetical protein
VPIAEKIGWSTRKRRCSSAQRAGRSTKRKMCISCSGSWCIEALPPDVKPEFGPDREIITRSHPTQFTRPFLMPIVFVEKLEFNGSLRTTTSPSSQSLSFYRKNFLQRASIRDRRFLYKSDGISLARV